MHNFVINEYNNITKLKDQRGNVTNPQEVERLTDLEDVMHPAVGEDFLRGQGGSLADRP